MQHRRSTNRRYCSKADQREKNGSSNGKYYKNDHIDVKVRVAHRSLNVQSISKTAERSLMSRVCCKYIEKNHENSIQHGCKFIWKFPNETKSYVLVHHGRVYARSKSVGEMKIICIGW